MFFFTSSEGSWFSGRDTAWKPRDCRFDSETGGVYGVQLYFSHIIPFRINKVHLSIALSIDQPRLMFVSTIPFPNQCPSPKNGDLSDHT